MTAVSSHASSPIAVPPRPYGAPANGAKVTPIRPVSNRRAGPAQAAEVAELEDVAEPAERRWLQTPVRGTGDDRLLAAVGPTG